MDKRKSAKRRVRRNKYKMRLDLLEAVRDVLKEKGFVNLNINNVAQMADVDRNAIYRHFGTFDNLLSQYMQSKNYLLDWLDKVKDEEVDNHRVFLKQLINNQYDALNRNSEMQQLIVWELAELSLRTKTMAQHREILAEKWMKQFEEYFADSQIDINVVTAIIISGVYFLTIHKHHSNFFMIDFVKEKERILKGIEQLIDVIFDAREEQITRKTIALRALYQGLDKQMVAEITGLTLNDIENIS